LLVFGLLEYEFKTSVLHFSVMRHEDYSAPVRSKDELITHIGFRRFLSRPVYSEVCFFFYNFTIPSFEIF